MKAIQFKEFGGPEVLELVDIEKPLPGPGQIGIAVRAAGVNPPDWKIREGIRREYFPRELPSGVGFDASGVVDAIGEGVTGVSIGDDVFGFGDDTFAEYAVLDSWVIKPERMTFEEAAAIPSSGETALRVLDALGIKAGETFLVSGAGGGAGSSVVQLARWRGATVIGTDAKEKHEYLRSLGAVPTTYEAGLVERVRALAPDGVDAALDVVGSDVIPELIEITGDPSRVGSLLLKNANTGITTTFDRSENAEEKLAELVRAYEDGAYRMHLDRTFPLEQTAQAQILSAEGRVTGKLVVVIS